MSEQKNDTIYCGGGKKMKDNWRKASICLTDLPQEHIFEYNGKKYIKININDRDEPNQFGKDISVSIDTFKPEVKSEVNEEEVKDLPF